MAEPEAGGRLAAEGRVVKVGGTPVLVTGATGFIGREVVRGLLAADRPVIALVRGRAGIPAEARLAGAVGAAPDGKRLLAVECDLADRRSRLPAVVLSRLRATVETVIHCAGDTAFFPTALASFRAGHVEGPRAVLEALVGGRLQRWVQVSTAFVCGRRTGRILETEGDVGQEFHNPYEGLKLQAEDVLRAAGRRSGVDVRVVRPSIVVGLAPETAGGAPANLFFDFIRLVAAFRSLAAGTDQPVRIAARPRARFNIVPIDYVTTAIRALAEHPDATGGTFHLVVAAAPSQEAMLGMIAERLGVRGIRLVESGEGVTVSGSFLERRLARLLAPYQDYLEQDVSFDDSQTRALLDPCGVRTPMLDAGAVEHLIDLALGPTLGGRPSARIPAPARALGDRW